MRTLFATVLISLLCGSLPQATGLSTSMRCSAGDAARPDIAPPKRSERVYPSVWDDYQIIVWQPKTAAQYRSLHTLGVSAGALISNGFLGHSVEAENQRSLIDGGMRWYAENIATDFYSAYHRWTPGKPPNWRFEKLRATSVSGMAPALLARDPGLEDPAWRKRISQRLADVVMAQRGSRPLFYNLGDETGLADLAAYWDFDFSPTSLAGMRRWLRRQYGSIDGLNREWRTGFRRWDEVIPLTALEATKRRDGDFAAWADFRAWMDYSFANALRDGRRALRRADPAALAGIEGGQAPGWGGYDYSLLAHAVDVFELYDMVENLDILHDLNPHAIVLTTASSLDAAEQREIWHVLLHGGRGLILWDPDDAYVAPDGTRKPLAGAAAPLFAALRSGVATLLNHATPAPAPVAIEYSPASFRTRWILTEQALGAPGIEAATHSDHPQDEFTALRDRVVGVLRAHGVQYRFVSSAQIAGGGLNRSAVKLIILPDSLAMSPAEGDAIRKFAGGGGSVVALGNPGLYDSHSRNLGMSPLASLFAPRSSRPASFERISLLDRHVSPSDLWAVLAAQKPAIQDQDGLGALTRSGIETVAFRDGGVRLVAYLGGSGSRHLHFSPAGYVYDLLGHRALGWTEGAKVTVSEARPLILAISPGPLPSLFIDAPNCLRRGKSVRVSIYLTAPSPAAFNVFHVEIVNPDGHVIGRCSRNLVARHGHASMTLRFAPDDPTGIWSLRVTDILRGAISRRALKIIKG